MLDDSPMILRMSCDKTVTEIMLMSPNSSAVTGDTTSRYQKKKLTRMRNNA